MKLTPSCELTHKCTAHVDLHFEHFDVRLVGDVHDDVHHRQPIDNVRFFSLQCTSEHFYREKYEKRKKGLKGPLYRERQGIAKRSALVLYPPVVGGAAA